MQLNSSEFSERFIVSGGHLLFPFYVGSVSYPLPMKLTRGKQLYRRICYMRSIYDNDAPSTSEEGNCKPKSFFGDDILTHMIHFVEFRLDRSFGSDAASRKLYSPPFFIDDNAWGEHLVEIHLHFISNLSIPSIIIRHLALLYPKPETIPTLSSISLSQKEIMKSDLNLFPQSSAYSKSSTEFLRNNSLFLPDSIEGKSTIQESELSNLTDSHTISVSDIPKVSNLTSKEKKQDSEKKAVTSKNDPSCLFPLSTITNTTALNVNEIENSPKLMISERRDAIRIWHPSIPLLEFIHFWGMKKNDNRSDINDIPPDTNAGKSFNIKKRSKKRETDTVMTQENSATKRTQFIDLDSFLQRKVSGNTKVQVSKDIKGSDTNEVLPFLNEILSHEKNYRGTALGIMKLVAQDLRSEQHILVNEVESLQKSLHKRQSELENAFHEYKAICHSLEHPAQFE